MGGKRRKALDQPRPSPQESGHSPERSPYGLVVIAASRGGIAALSRVLSALPGDFPIPIAVVLHRGMKLPNYQASVIGRQTPLRVKIASEAEPLQPRTVFLAPPHLHLTVGTDRKLALVDGRKIRHLRSSANPLFESAAEIFGPRVIAVVLTGGGRDATDGVQTVRKCGGTVIAQDEVTSEDFSMPRSAIATGAVEHVLPVEDIGPAIARLVGGTAT